MQREIKAYKTRKEMEVASVKKNTNWWRVKELKKVNKELTDSHFLLNRLEKKNDYRHKISKSRMNSLESQLESTEAEIRRIDKITKLDLNLPKQVI